MSEVHSDSWIKGRLWMVDQDFFVKIKIKIYIILYCILYIIIFLI